MKKTFCFIYLFCFAFNGLLADTNLRPADLQDQLEQTDGPERLQIWSNWYDQLRMEYFDYWEKNLEAACGDAQEHLEEEKAFDWCLDIHLKLHKRYFQNGLRIRSYRILQKAFELANNSKLSQLKHNKVQKSLYNAKGEYIYNKTNNVDSALIFFNSALSIRADAKTIEEDTTNFSVFLNLVEMFEAEKNYLRADDFLQKATALEKGMQLSNFKKLELKYLQYKLNHHTKRLSIGEEDYSSILSQSANIDSFLHLRIHIDYANFLFENNQQLRSKEYLSKLEETVDNFYFHEINHPFCLLSYKVNQQLGYPKKAYEYISKRRKTIYDEHIIETLAVRKEQKRNIASAEKTEELKRLLLEKEDRKSKYITWFSLLLICSTLILSVLFYFYQKNKNKNRQLILQKHREQTIITERNRLFSSISSEIKQPLGQMMSILNMTKQDVISPQASNDIALAQRNGSRLMELFDQIGDWNNIEARLLKVNETEVDLQHKLLSSASRLEIFANEKKVPFQTDIKIHEGLYLLDYEKINRILSNLIGNAIKFSEPNQEVRLVATEDLETQNLSLKVIDNGPGISESDLKNLFKQHFQGEAGLKKGGTGIGLATVHELVELLGGSIQCDSELGKGTTFSVQVPFKKLNSQNTIEEASDDSKALLLLVEDDPELLNFVKSNFNKKYNVITASNAEDGAKLAFDQIPTLIISDWNLGNNTGGWLCKQVKGNPITSHIPIMILTGFTSEEQRQEVYEAEAIARMEKPFQLSALNAQVTNILSQIKFAQIDWKAKSDTNPPPDESKAPSFLDDFSKVIQENMEQEFFSVEKMADLLFLSRSQLFRKVKNTTGKSPSVHLSEARLAKSRELLQNSDLTITDIAYKVGFSDPNYFSTSYKKHFGSAPSEDRTA